jgi:hypothetical protein
MKSIRTFCLLVLATGMALAQANQPGSSNVDDDLKSLREAIAAQQKQIAAQKQQLEILQKQLDADTSGAPHLQNATLTTTASAPVINTSVTQAESEKPKESPLSFRIGAAEFTPGGYVDFANIFRTTNTGNDVTTAFWAIPFNNITPAGNLTEFRSTAASSRINLKTTARILNNTQATGYIEADFNGNDANSVFVTTNPHTMRLRLYWVDLRPGKWEFLAGSTWGLQTPNRVGISPAPADLSLTIGADNQTHVGVNYTRAAEFRVGFHFTKNFAWAVAAQNPQQFLGQPAGQVQLPAGFKAIVTPQFDQANNPGTPNLAPDLITKFAYDSAGRKFHLELGGLATSPRVGVVPTVAAAGFVKHHKWVGGAFGAFNIEVIKNLRVLAQGMYGTGVGRYLIGMGPQVVIAPVPATAGGTCTNGPIGDCDVHLSPVRSGDLLLGVEAQPTAKTQFGFYYGGAYFQRNTFPDLTVAGAVQPAIGFGGAATDPAIAGIMNRAIQEGTIDWTQTFWKSPQFGAVMLVTQASYVTRAPWLQVAPNPKNAHLTMAYVTLRYVLP